LTLLIFVHVPKAAGTTLQRVIDDRYPRRKVLTFADPEEAEAALARMTEAERDEIEAVKGHVHFGVHRYFRRPARYVTMLRHPVARIASHYRYARSNSSHYLHDEVVGRNLDLAGYAASDLSDELQDGQLRMFSARARELAPPDEAALEEAKRMLEHEFAVVGLTERFDESLLLMQESLGWTTPYYARENESRGSLPKLSEEALAAIEAANPLDFALYGFAEELLAREIAAHSGFDERLERFRRRNRVLGPVSRVRGLGRRFG